MYLPKYQDAPAPAGPSKILHLKKVLTEALQHFGRFFLQSRALRLIYPKPYISGRFSFRRAKEVDATVPRANIKTFKPVRLIS